MRSLVFAGGSTIGCFVFGFLLAYLIYRPFPGQALYYALFILPMLTVPIVIAYSAQMLLDRNGPINDILSMLTGHEIRVLWLSDPNIALPTVTLLDIWNWTPFSFIIMLAGLSSLPKEPVEAAQILGASSWRIFWEVQLPLLRPVILLALVLRFLDAMGAFPIIWALLQGGPGTATETLGIYIYITTWQDFNVSLGAAQSYITMVMMVVIVLVGIRLLRKEKRSFDSMYAKPRETGEPHDQDAKALRRCGNALRDPDGVGVDGGVSALLDDHHLVQAERPVVLMAAGMVSIAADPGELPRRVAGHDRRRRRRAVPPCRCRRRSGRCATA